MKNLKNVPKQVEKVVERVVVNEPTIVEEEGGLITFMGKKVLLQCMNYNYTGVLVGVNTTCVELEKGQVVFDTGPYTSDTMKFSEPVHKGRSLFVMMNTIESFWEV